MPWQAVEKLPATLAVVGPLNCRIHRCVAPMSSSLACSRTFRQRVARRADRPIRKLRALVDTTRGEINDLLSDRYAECDRPSIPSERISRASVLQVDVDVCGIQPDSIERHRRGAGIHRRPDTLLGTCVRCSRNSLSRDTRNRRLLDNRHGGDAKLGFLNGLLGWPPAWLPSTKNPNDQRPASTSSCHFP